MQRMKNIILPPTCRVNVVMIACSTPLALPSLSVELRPSWCHASVDVLSLHTTLGFASASTSNRVSLWNTLQFVSKLIYLLGNDFLRFLYRVLRGGGGCEKRDGRRTPFLSSKEKKGYLHSIVVKPSSLLKKKKTQPRMSRHTPFNSD